MRNGTLKAIAMAVGPGTVLCAAPAAVAPEVLTLTPLRVQLREGRGPAYRLVATAAQGEKVTLLEKDERGWLHLQRDPTLGGEKGYAHERALKATASKPGSGNASAALAGRPDKPEITAAAAAKGIQPQTQIYAVGKGWDTAALAELRRRREMVTYDEYSDFFRGLMTGQ